MSKRGIKAKEESKSDKKKNIKGKERVMMERSAIEWEKNRRMKDNGMKEKKNRIRKMIQK